MTRSELSVLLAFRLQGLSDADVRQLQSVLDEQVEANLGMAMIYTLIGVAQEWLNEKVGCAAQISCIRCWERVHFSALH